MPSRPARAVIDTRRMPPVPHPSLAGSRSGIAGLDNMLGGQGMDRGSGMPTPRPTLLGQETETNRICGDMLAQVSDAVVARGADERIVYLNAAAEALYGVSASDAYGRSITELRRNVWASAADEAAALCCMRENGGWRGEIVQICHDGRMLDVEITISLLRTPEGHTKGFLSVIRDIAERKRSEAHVQLLMAEINHRAKNLLAVVQAVTRQTARCGDPATFARRLGERLDGLAAGQDLLVRNHWRGVELADLIDVQLAHFKDLTGSRIHIAGPPVLLTAGAAQAIGMALHELTTNAAKYGALSNADGHVHIAWETSAGREPRFKMSWREQGGPPVRLPTRKGFGGMILGRMAEAAVDGHVEISLNEAGVAWTLIAPAANVTVEPSGGAIDDGV